MFCYGSGQNIFAVLLTQPGTVQQVASALSDADAARVVAERRTRTGVADLRARLGVLAETGSEGMQRATTRMDELLRLEAKRIKKQVASPAARLLLIGYLPDSENR